MFPCVQLRLPAGNLRERSLRQIWEESPLWLELMHLTMNDLDICRTCELQSLCLRCHGLARLEDGDLRGPARAKCTEALARRQVLMEKGALPQDYPVPRHLSAVRPVGTGVE
ncbi:MAG: hypothetical protein HYX94_11305 [Chloroflexi bacterium]|nr:hypothetical protein [Chloroflexota bacterium]